MLLQTLTPGLLLLAALAPTAQQENPNAPKPRDPSSATTRDPRASTQQPGDTGPLLRRGDRLIGTEIVDASGASVGRVDDLVLRSNGEIAFAIVKTAEGTKYYPVPWSQLHFPIVSDPSNPDPTLRDERATLRKGNELDKAPSFENAQWPDLEDPTAFDESSRFFGDMTEPIASDDELGIHRPTTFLRASQLTKQNILDVEGKPIGTMDLVVFDPTAGRANYATIHLRDARGNDLNTVAMPWEIVQVTRQAGHERFQVTLPGDRLQAAPQFRSGDAEWQAMSNRRYVDELYKYYSVRPYWTNSARPNGDSSSAASGRGTGDARQRR